MLTTIIIFFLVLLVLVLIHEYGHFIVARRNGITCHEFGFGFAPRIVGRVRDSVTGAWQTVWGNKPYYGKNTLYSFNALPLGGFVHIKGQNGNDVDPDSFASKSIWTRFKVLFAGPLMNFILGWFLIMVALMIGMPDVAEYGNIRGNIVSEPEPQIARVQQDSPAEEMKLRIGDKIQRVCTVDVCTKTTTSQDVVAEITERRGTEASVHVKRGDETVVLTGTPRVATEANQGALGIELIDTVIVQYDWNIAPIEALVRTIGVIAMIFTGLGTFFASLFGAADPASAAELTGPVGIGVMTGQMFDLGIGYFLQFVAILSINLGFINLLPIPALDGGRILFLGYEKITGRPLPGEIEARINYASFVLLMALMVWVTVKDFARFL